MRINESLAVSLLGRLDLWRESEGGRYRLPGCVDAGALVGLALEVAGDDLTLFPSGEMLVWEVARHEGYDIPPYPMAGCGEGRRFLSDQGVSSIPAWYAARGIPTDVTASFYAYACLMARNRGFWRKVMPVPALDLADASRAAAHLSAALRFCLGDETGEADRILFRC